MISVGRLAIASAVVITCLEGSGWAQTSTRRTASAARRVQPAELNGVTFARSGRVAGPLLPPNDAAIAAGMVPADSPELSVEAAASRALSPKEDGQIDLQILDRETTARFGALDHCRADTARHKRVAPGLIKAHALTLRWTLTPKGEVTFMEVVGRTPVDADVLDCVKREARNWRFTAPVGGEVRLERPFVFRPLSPDPPAR